MAHRRRASAGVEDLLDARRPRKRLLLRLPAPHHPPRRLRSRPALPGQSVPGERRCGRRGGAGAVAREGDGGCEREPRGWAGDVVRSVQVQGVGSCGAQDVEIESAMRMPLFKCVPQVNLRDRSGPAGPSSCHETDPPFHFVANPSPTLNPPRLPPPPPLPLPRQPLHPPCGTPSCRRKPTDSALAWQYPMLSLTSFSAL